MKPAASISSRLVILDRDGVINQDSDTYIKSAAEWMPIPGSIDAIAQLSRAGFLVAVASNQSGLARRLFTLAELNAMHQKLTQLVAAQGGWLELIAFCPHGPDAGCRCRKPAPGLLLEIADRMGQDLDGVPFIGDSISDIRAARAAGAVPWLVRTGKGERTLQAVSSQGFCELEAVPVHANLEAAVTAILNERRLS